jgi:hypothetical protein
MLKIDESKLKIYSTVMYCDDRVKYTIYIAAINKIMANIYFYLNHEIQDLKEKHTELCNYPISLLTSSLFNLDLSGREYFLNNNSNIIIFEPTPI